MPPASSSRRQSDPDLFMRLIDHVFLPRMLPQSSNVYEIQDEALLLTEMVELIKTFADENYFGPRFTKTHQLFETWGCIQGYEALSAREIQSAIKSLDIGQSLAFYVRQQNSCIMILIPEAEGGQNIAILSTFPTSLQSDVIMKSGELNTITCSYPALTIQIPVSSLLHSKVLSEQLVVLCDNQFEIALSKSRKAGRENPETREVADPMLVTELLTGTITNAESHVRDFALITKKVRDDVVFKNALLPFRRSGMYMAIKVALQLSLVCEFGENEGYFVYKFIMVQFLTTFLSLPVSMDLGIQMLAKVSRRIFKLDKYYRQHVNLLFSNLYFVKFNIYYENQSKLLTKARDRLDQIWNNIIHIEKEKWFYSLPALEYKDGIQHLLISTKSYLIHEKYGLNAPKPHPGSQCPPRLTFQLEFPRASFLQAANEKNMAVAFYDIENWIRNDFENIPNSGTYSDRARDFLKTYFNNGKSYYCNDPVGYSRLILNCFKIVQVFDRVSTLTHPLLLQHRSGVNTSCISNLLLPSKADLQLAREIESYFSTRDSNASHPSLIEESEVTTQSLAARYGSVNPTMNQLKGEMLDRQDSRIREKFEELRRIRERCKSLKLELSGISGCTYREVALEDWEETWRIERTRTEHSSSCKKCSLENQISNCKCGVYEKALPDADYLRSAIAFEFLIPPEIACLRDILYLMASAICIEEGARQSSSPSSFYQWTKGDQISDLDKTNIRPHSVHLGSTLELFMKSRHTQKVVHVDVQSDSSYIIKNGYNCKYGSSTSLSLSSYGTVVRKPFIHTVQPGSPYSNMQWALDSTGHTENQVLARQVERHVQLDPREFKVFGSLRAGNRLQLRNIYKALEDGSLNFQTESVFSLICQCVWEAGPIGNGGLFRDSHADLEDPNFDQTFLELLLSVLDSNSENWTQPLYLITVINLSTRILSVSEDTSIQPRAASVTRKCREVANKWVRKIKACLNKMLQAPIEKVNEIRQLLILNASAIALTFDVDSERLPLIMSNTEDQVDWLQAIVWIDENIVLSGSANMPILYRNLLRRIHRTALSLENFLNHKLLEGPEGLTQFVQNHWSGSDGKDENGWIQLPSPRQQIWYSEWSNVEDMESMTVEVDIVIGTFLVNGNPVGRLPQTITNHSDFMRVFQRAVFEVHSEGPGKFVTSIGGRIYKFFIGENSKIAIVECQANEEFQLFPNQQFGQDIPILLVNNYSHWWNKKSNKVVFRPVLFSDKEFTTRIDYYLNLSTSILTDVKTRKWFVDINSAKFLPIAKIISRLEHANYIHLMFSEEENEASIELPRMGLNFNIKQGEILSHEFSGKRVASIQTFGTLVGLQHGLLLEGLHPDDNSVLLVPHGGITVKPGVEDGQQVVTIDHSSHSNPGHFAYEIDSRLRTLKAGQNHTGWLYLAHLHAMTASALPDPFTGLTGTESAMRILQSGHAWSCRPLNGTAVSILQNISNLTPHRRYYPSHLKCMQSVTWPVGLPSIAADDAFALIVDKLVSDSRRLSRLFPTESCGQTSFNSTRDLTVRAYNRNMAYCGEQARITRDLDTSRNMTLKSKKAESFEINLENENMKNVRKIAHLGYTWTSAAAISDTTSILHQLFLNSYSGSDIIQGVSPGGYNSNSNLPDWFAMQFRNMWLDLYNFARRIGHDEDLRTRWTMLLCFLAYNEVNIDHLLLLHTVAVFSSEFKKQHPPPHREYSSTFENDFNGSAIVSEIICHGTGVNQYLISKTWDRMHRESDLSFKNRITAEYNALVKTEAENLGNKVQGEWPTSSCSSSVYTVSCPHINLYNAINGINAKLLLWYTNYELKMFLNQVGKTVKQIQTLQLTHSTGTPNYSIWQQPGSDVVKTTLVIGFDDILELSEIDNDNIGVDRDAQEIFRKGSDPKAPATNPSPPSFLLTEENSCPVESFYKHKILGSVEYHIQDQLTQPRTTQIPKVEDLAELREYYKERGGSLWNNIQNTIYQPDQNAISKSLFAGGLFPRFTPTVLLPYICIRNTPETLEIMLHLQNFIGALCVTWTLEQRIIRCLRYLRSNTGMEVALKREILNAGHGNWSPAERPEWLLLELEMDMMIRPIQITVAEQMLDPPDDGKNALMQLNMGEGKTAVIVPLLVAAIADGKKLCRVTVLRSLHEINYRSLILKLGGLLNRRVYNFPCRRDMNIGATEAKLMLDLHEECLRKGGVVLTRPEHRLSLELKTLEKCRAGTADAKEFLNLLKWLQENARDVLDESDEILHAKYQLVYTMGDQRPIDGKGLRWTVAEDVLKIAQFHMQSIVDEFGKDSAEFIPTPKQPERFPHFRLLTQELDPYKKLCKLIVEEFIKRESCQTPFPPITTEQKLHMEDFLIHPSTDPKSHEFILALFKDHRPALDTILILRGILACGVLQLTLSKRWRVNYGVNPIGERMMAVPFRAKDVAAEKTEFGHPDVAILYTLLSYYYSGLSDRQIDQCFEFLLKFQNPELEYEQWVACVPNIHASIAKYNGVNLSDFEQKRDLIYPSFKMNVAVINFWLNHAVFPVESKQFEGKMVCTAWDLCRDDGKYPVTGFSGTNDSELLLPLSIAQKDLPQLQGTNGQVLCNLLLPENNNYYFISSGTSSVEVLKRITKESIRVLLDVGALILELTNRQVAVEWLKLLPRTEVDAVVYFDKFDRLVVIDRHELITEFEISSYRERLNRCAVYLDDIHTRGTDLKMPSGFKACVTLGNGVTKDKLVQGCMRMRMLGQGHTVQFLASQEVHNAITTSFQDSTKISTQNVLQWAMKNSCIATRDNMLHWAAAGYNFAQKHAAKNIFEMNSKSDYVGACISLGMQCTDKEVVELMKFYGSSRREEFIPGIAKLRQNQVKDELQGKLNRHHNYDLSTNKVNGCFEYFGTKILQKCITFVPDVKIYSQLLEEEQERELSPEVQEERQVSGPGPATPNAHNLHARVKHFVSTGEIVAPTEWAVKLPRALDGTSVAGILQENAWGENIWATKDFVKVVVPGQGAGVQDGIQMFLRSPTWIAVVTDKPNAKILLLLSPFEANELIPFFRTGRMKAVLRMFSPRLHPSQDILLSNEALQIPSTGVIRNPTEHLTVFYAHLSMFAGGLYFEDEAEQMMFCNVFGLAPHPLSEEEQIAFDRGEIKYGFINPSVRPMLRGLQNLCRFKSSPTDLIRKIINMRHGATPPHSHVSLVVLESKKALKSPVAEKKEEK